jgi:phage baseplate assembly protein W
MALIARKFDYSDLDLDFIPHPTTGDVLVKFGDDAIKRSVRNLILTNFYDRPFRPYIGSNVQKLLFELATPITANLIKDSILEVIENYEPRIRIMQLSVELDDENNGFNVIIEYEILNRGEPAIITLFLERIR